MSKEDVGPAIRDAREALGVSQEEFALMVGVSRETVGNWETGQTFPRNKAHRLRTEYGVDIHEIALRPKAAPVETPAPAGSDPLVYGIESAVASLRAGKDAQGVATFLETLLRGHQAHA